jgi:hypothetical protein
MHLNLVMTQNQGAPRQQVTTEERKQTIAQFESRFYGLSTMLKERLLITTDERFTNKMDELMYYATNGSVYVT